MNTMLLSGIGLLFATQAFAEGGASLNLNQNTSLLPSPFPVYVIENYGVVNHPYPGAKEVFLPTDNTYKDSPGCYIACDSHKPGVYSVSSDISVIGQIRVRGKYIIRTCQPEGYKNMDISKSDQLKQLCGVKFDVCNDKSCWAGGDTGGWFGIQ